MRGALWDLNPFDQWGAELGKQLCGGVLLALRHPSRAGEAPAGLAGLLGWINVRDQRRRAVGTPLAIPASGVTTSADRCIALGR